VAKKCPAFCRFVKLYRSHAVPVPLQFPGIFCYFQWGYFEEEKVMKVVIEAIESYK
jgi:hypothetical protein